MVWFTGSVEEAVQLCKQRAGLLTIFVRGKRFHSHSGRKFSGILFPQSNFSRVKYLSDNSDECSGLEAYFEDAEVEAVINQRNDILLLKITQGTTKFDLLNSVCKLETRVSFIFSLFWWAKCWRMTRFIPVTDPVASIPMVQFHWWFKWIAAFFGEAVEQGGNCEGTNGWK